MAISITYDAQKYMGNVPTGSLIYIKPYMYILAKVSNKEAKIIALEGGNRYKDDPLPYDNECVAMDRLKSYIGDPFEIITDAEITITTKQINRTV